MSKKTNQKTDEKAVETVEQPETVLENVEQPETVLENVEQPETVLESIEQPETILDRHLDKPIVLLVVNDEKLAEIASKSFMEYFNGEIAALVVRYPKDGESLAETLAEFAMDYENEKIILLDNIISISPFTMADIEVLKAMPSANLNAETLKLLKETGFNTVDFRTKAPVVLERSKIIELLEDFPSADFKNVDFLSIYFNRFYFKFRPILTDWKTDCFTLPVVSKNPSHDVLKAHMQLKRWFAVSANSVDAVLEFFNEA